MGRPATGRIRNLRFPLNLSSDEREYLARRCFALQSVGFDTSQADIILETIFSNGWIDELKELRDHQKNIKIKMPWLKRNRKSVPSV